MTATGIVPRTIAQAVGARAATIQDKWFARLFLIKALVIASLALFWTVSGFISLVISYDAAAGILRDIANISASACSATTGPCTSRELVRMTSLSTSSGNIN